MTVSICSWVHDSHDWITLCAWRYNSRRFRLSRSRPSLECMTVSIAWQSSVHDSLECMTVSSAWHSWVHNSHDWITLRLPFVRDAMIAADFDFRVPDPHLDFCFPESFRFTIICVAIAILSWPSLRLSISAPSLRLSPSQKLSHHNNLLGHCQPLLTPT